MAPPSEPNEFTLSADDNRGVEYSDVIGDASPAVEDSIISNNEDMTEPVE